MNKEFGNCILEVEKWKQIVKILEDKHHYCLADEIKEHVGVFRFDSKQ